MCVCILALVVWHANNSIFSAQHYIITCGLSALPYSSSLTLKQQGFRKKYVAEHKMCVLIFYTTFVYNIFHSKNNSATHYHKCTQIFMQSARYPCSILIKFKYSRQILEKSVNIKHFVKIRPRFSTRTAGLKEGQTHMTKVNKTSSRFASSPASLAFFLDKPGHWVCTAPKQKDWSWKWEDAPRSVQHNSVRNR